MFHCVYMITLPLLIQVASFIREQTETQFQCIVISLKEEFYGHADALVGICPDVSWH